MGSRPPPPRKREVGYEAQSRIRRRKAGGEVKDRGEMGSHPPPRKCDVCYEAQSKYKCPSCLAPYCSLACFKKHKENPCKKPLPLVEEPPNLMLPKQSHEVDEPSWVVAKEHLQLIANSSEIREALKDGDLRRIIQKIDGADDPEDLLTKLMEGQNFHDFTEKILSVVSPQK